MPCYPPAGEAGDIALPPGVSSASFVPNESSSNVIPVIGECLSHDLAQAFVTASSSALTRGERAAIHEHLATCKACREWISALVAALESDSKHLPPPPEESASEFHIGDVLGRYRIERWLGQGGMGRVFVAHDEALNRKVAVKHLRRETGASRRRFVREARILARLHDPNIAAIYDVGEHDGCSYLVMELVDGVALDVWLRERPRTFAELLEVFIAAGRGLAAAHRHGVLHRDFKPSNAIVGHDGRVRVIDFGLAGSTATSVVEITAGPEERAAGDARALTFADDSAGIGALTRDGAIAGTPGYLAPELTTGGRASVRSDQYAFCISFSQALAAHLRPPRWLHDALARGLSPHPAARWPSMDALLAALERGSAGRTRVLMMAVGVAIAVAMGVGSEPEASAPCGSDSALETTWNARRANGLVDAIIATGVPYAQRAAERARARLDAFAQAWTHAATRACTSSQGLELDHRQQCLAARLRQLDATAVVLERSSAEATANIETLLALPDPATCLHVSASDATMLDPGIPPGAREEMQELEAALDRLEVLVAAGASAAARRGATALSPRIDATSQPRLAARLELILGSSAAALLDTAAEPALQRALSLASAAGDDALAARAALTWAETVGPPAERADPRGRNAVEQARAFVRRAGSEPTLQCRLAQLEAWLLAAEGDEEAALQVYEQARALCEAVYGVGSAQVALVLVEVGKKLRSLGRLQESLATQEQALALLHASVGPDHPWTARVHENLGFTLLLAGRPDEARAAYETNLRVTEAAFGADHVSVAFALANWGGTFTALGRPGEAVPLLERAVPLLERHDVDPLVLASVLNNLGNAHRLEGQMQAAAAAYARAVVLLEEALGSNHPNVAVTLAGLAMAQLALNDPAALASARRAVAIQRDQPGERPGLPFALLVLGQTHHAAGHFDDAIATLHEARTQAEEGTAGARFVPDLEYAMAQVLVSAGREEPDAEAMARRAAQTYAARGDETAAAEVDAWLAEVARENHRRRREG